MRIDVIFSPATLSKEACEAYERDYQAWEEAFVRDATEALLDWYPDYTVTVDVGSLAHVRVDGDACATRVASLVAFAAEHAVELSYPEPDDGSHEEHYSFRD